MSLSQTDVSSPESGQGGVDRRLLIAIAVIAGLALTFWFGSRYPALNHKALMGGDAPLSGLAFDILFDIFPNSPLWWQFVANTLNWIYTNLKGMTFGVLFGAAIITVLSLIRKRAFEGSFANAALGTAIGAPLGVCVNCAAPIAFGLHMGRMRLETTLAALMASPTLNVIVVTMSFSLLPTHIAATKLALAIVMVLFVVPMLCKYVLVAETEATRTGMPKLARVSEARGLSAWIGRSLAPVDAGAPPASWVGALVWFVRSYTRNLFFIGIITVPMMILAGMMGAIIAMGFDSSALMGVLPRAGAVPVLMAMLGIAVVASIAPAPIALDVILTIVLMSVGMTSDYATVVMIALGSYSVYAFFILWRAVSPRTAIIVWIATLFMAVLGGVIARETRDIETAYYKASMDGFLENREGFDWPRIPALPPAPGLEDLAGDIATQALVARPVAATISGDGADRIALLELPYASPVQQSQPINGDAPIFARVPGAALGFENIGISTPIHEFAPGMMLGGIAAGDIHNDGWPDIVVRRPTGARGLSLYANIGGSFQRQHVDLGPLADLEVVNVAFADLDNDGWLDLIASTYWNGMFILNNKRGEFSQESLHHIAEAPLAMAPAISFADMNDDGHLDILVGAWASGQGFEGWMRSRAETATNYILWNRGDLQFDRQNIAGSPGMTLTTLVTDINRDGQPDFLKGDDVAGTDQVVFFGQDGSTHADPDAQPFAYALRTTMSYDEGDWNNDLIPDYYGGQISERGGSDEREAARGDGRVLRICQQFARDLGWTADQTRDCAADVLSTDSIRGLKAGLKSIRCRSTLLTERDTTVCGIAQYLRNLREAVYFDKTTTAKEAHARCRAELERWPFTKNYCDSFLTPVLPRVTKKMQEEQFMPVITSGNILMTGTPDAGFVDKASAQEVAFPGWTWNSRFSDLDQDGWQDLLVMTGIWLGPSRSTSNKFYRNEMGQFSDQTDRFGFFDLVPSFSYVSVDFDRDGDVDVIRPPDGFAAIVHRNDRPAGPALWVRLRDEVGNSMGIGARVTICTDGQTEVAPGKCQTRPINAGGGFMSFDLIAAHFGLGQARSVDLIEVVWRDGTRSRILPKGLTGGDVIVTRKAAR